MTAYYNEHNKYAAQWLRNLIADGHITPGDVDERNIQEVMPDDIKGYTQVHLFAGIGGWSRALRLANWPDTHHVWTGSCPCQPFSAVGQKKGVTDERHLWSEMYRLIRECNPSHIFGEQVAAAIGFNWLDLVSDDLEAAGYTVGTIVLPACSIGAPHIRQRLWFGAQRLSDADGKRRTQPQGQCANAGSPGRVIANADDSGTDGRVAQRIARDSSSSRPGTLDRFWQAADWLRCRDDKWRPVEPCTFPLANGVSARVGRLRAYGNAIVPQVAAEIIAAFMEYQRAP